MCFGDTHLSVACTADESGAVEQVGGGGLRYDISCVLYQHSAGFHTPFFLAVICVPMALHRPVTPDLSPAPRSLRTVFYMSS